MVGRKRKNQTTAHETLERKAVRFSKRRKGLFNKAAELCMLAGCQVAIVVSSPVSEDTLYSFGHPSADAVFDAYLNNRVPDAVDNAAAMGSAIALYNENKEMEYELEKAKNKGEKRSDETDHGCWWDSEDLGKNESISELQVIVENLEKLRENAFVRMNYLLSSVLSAPGSSAASASNVDYDCKTFNFGNNVYNGNNNNNNEIGISSVSNYASIDENYVTGVNNDLEANLRAGRQEVNGLENNAEQNYFRNLLITDFEIANNEAPWCIFNNDAMHPAHQNSADCAADQNHNAYSADQSKPIATANEFEQLFNWDKS